MQSMSDMVCFLTNKTAFTQINRARKDTTEDCVSRRRNYACIYSFMDILREDRVAAADGGAAELGGAGRDADGSVRPGDNRPSYPPRHRRKMS